MSGWSGVTAFHHIFNSLPDLDRPPAGDKFMLGDVCKVKGRPMVWQRHFKWNSKGLALMWVDMETAMGETYVVEKLTGKPG